MNEKEERKMKYILLMIVILSLFFVNFTSADVTSINSGGGEDVVINPDTYIEGFFSCVPYTCSQLSYECGTWNDGCGRTLSCGTCASGYTCSAGTCVAEEEEEGEEGGDGVSETTPTVEDIEIIPSKFDITLAVNTTTQETISVKNLGDSSLNLSISENGLGNHVILDKNYLYVEPGQTKSFEVIFVALSEPGIYTGSIIINGKSVSVSLDVKTKLLLFDSNIVVLNKDYRVGRGDELKTKITLLPMGDPERLDVTLNYVIRDYEGKVYLTQTESVLVEEEVSFKKNFDTGALPLGEYIVGLELVYPGGVAPSSAHFEIVEKTPEEFIAKLIFYLIILIIIVAIIIVIFLIRRKTRE